MYMYNAQRTEPIQFIHHYSRIWGKNVFFLSKNIINFIPPLFDNYIFNVFFSRLEIRTVLMTIVYIKYYIYIIYMQCEQIELEKNIMLKNEMNETKSNNQKLYLNKYNIYKKKNKEQNGKN